MKMESSSERVRYRLARTREGIQGIQNDLVSINIDVHDANRWLIDGFRPAKEHESVQAFTGELGKLRAEVGVSWADIGRVTFDSKTQIGGYLTGERAMRPEKLEDTLNGVEELSEVPVASEVKDRLRELGRAANEVPRNRRERLKKAELLLGGALAQAAVTISRVDALQAAVDSIEEELDRFLTSTSYDVITRKPILNAADTRREQQLRRRLATVRAELEVVLREQKENFRDLRDHAQRLADMVREYLAEPHRRRARRRIVHRRVC